MKEVDARVSLVLTRIEILKLKADPYNWSWVPEPVKKQLDDSLLQLDHMLADDNLGKVPAPLLPGGEHQLFLTARHLSAIRYALELVERRIDIDGDIKRDAQAALACLSRQVNKPTSYGTRVRRDL